MALTASKTGPVGVSALEMSAAQAGMALGCAYSSSAEFDAALIADRRAAGVYGPRRYRQQAIAAAAVVAALATISLIIAAL